MHIFLTVVLEAAVHTDKLITFISLLCFGAINGSDAPYPLEQEYVCLQSEDLNSQQQVKLNTN